MGKENYQQHQKPSPTSVFRRFGTARRDPSTGNLLRGEVNQYGEPQGSSQLRDTMTPEPAWRSKFPRPPLTGPAYTASLAGQITPPPPPVTGTGTLGSVVASGVNAANSAGQVAQQAGADSVFRRAAQARREALQLGVANGAGKNSGGTVTDRELVVDATKDPRIAAARAGQVVATPYGTIGKAATVTPATQAGAIVSQLQPQPGVSRQADSLVAQVQPPAPRPPGSSVGVRPPSPAAEGEVSSDPGSFLNRLTPPMYVGDGASLRQVWDSTKGFVRRNLSPGLTPVPFVGDSSIRDRFPNPQRLGMGDVRRAEQDDASPSIGGSSSDAGASATAALNSPFRRRKAQLMDQPAQQY